MKENQNDDISNKKKSKVIIDKEIVSINDDYIGIEQHVNTIKDAINDGAELISLSSGYGGGKSSLCKILSNDEMFGKTSIVSLWDVVIDKDYKQSTQEKNGTDQPKDITPEKEFSLLNLYKSFLFQLAGDYKSARYSKYVNKALNKTTTFFNIYSKSRLFFFSIVLFFIFGLVYALSFGIEFKYQIKWFSDMDIIVNQMILQYFSLFGIVLTVFFMFMSGKILYTSWKTERDRLITNDDVTALYVDLINDSISRNCKKNLIIIEDVDRCLDDKTINDEQILSFLKGLLKLKHYSCKNSSLNKKLRSVVFVVAINEAKIYSRNFPKSDELLKLFDYRLDLGKIHNDDFDSILSRLLLSVNIPSNCDLSKFKVVLRSKNNSIRLLKCVINDALLKYNTLQNKFKNAQANIRLESCIAYSYLKNNYYDQFTIFLANDYDAVCSINEAIKRLDKGQEINFTTNESTVLGKNNKGLNEFKNEMEFFIKNRYIDFDFKLYFYNYPKGEKITTIQQSIFKGYIVEGKPLNVENNKCVEVEYIKEIQQYVIEQKLSYPLNILEDKYVSKILFERPNDDCLYNFLLDSLKLDNEKNQIIATSNTKKIFDLDNRDNVLKYFLRVYKENWNKENIITETKEFYEFRFILTEYFKDDIVEFRNLFINSFDSITVDEFEFLNDKKIAYQLINMTKFSNGLTAIIPKLIEHLKVNENVTLAKYWEKNCNNDHDFAQYMFSLMKHVKIFNYELLNLFKNYYSFVDEYQFSEYYNSILQNISLEELKKINQLKYRTKLSEENLAFLLKNSLKTTPLVSLLYNKQYSDILNENVDYSTCFSNMNSSVEPTEYDYLINNIKEFKSFLLYNVNSNNRFDYLFIGNYEIKYPVDIDWSTVINVHLLFIKNYSNVNNIIENIQTRNYIYENILDIFNEMDLIPYNYNSIKCEIFIQLLTKNAETIKSNLLVLDEKIKLLINSLNSNCDKAKASIYYQIILNIVEPAYDNVIKSFGQVDDKQKYAEYLNELEETPPIDSILCADTIYPFNERIILLLLENKYFVIALKSSILSNNIKLIDVAICNLSAQILIDVYREEEYKNNLLTNMSFLNKVKSAKMTGSISINDFIDVLNIETNIGVLKFIIENYSDNIILNVLNSLKIISSGTESLFIEVISKKGKTIAGDMNLCARIKKMLPKNYRSSFTLKVIKPCLIQIG